jgi:hypothetical protein
LHETRCKIWRTTLMNTVEVDWLRRKVLMSTYKEMS